MSTNLSTTSSKWLASATKQLEAENITTARLDAIIILEEVLGLPRIKLISEPNIPLNDQQIKELNKLLQRRLKDEPIAYIRGFSEFYGHKFYVDENVLIPRPESETFIDLVKQLDISKAKIADVGCGNGCIGLSVKLELPESKVVLIDISESALSVARKNADYLKVSADFKNSNLLEGAIDDYDILLANLPYVPDEMSKLINLSHEPALALFAGNNGLVIYIKFWKQIKSLGLRPKFILCESLIQQHDHMNHLALIADYELSKTDGLIQLFKPI